MPYTYLIGWRSKDVWYYGSRWAKAASPSDLWKTYFTSSKRVARLREELGEPDVVEVRRVFDTSDAARRWETRVIQRMGMVKSERWLNQTDSTGHFFWPDKHTPEARAKIAAASTGRRHTAESKAKISAANRGRVHSEQTRSNMSAAHIGRPGRRHTDEAKRKITASKLGRKHSEETKAKMAAAKLGKPGPWLGKTRSEEDRAKMSMAARERRKAANAG